MDNDQTKNLPASILTKKQKQTMKRDNLDGTSITVELRFDDCCRNGNNEFSITGTHYDADGKIICCGCIHELISKYCIDLRHLIKWHLCSTKGPLHYIKNTMYLAGVKDCWGRIKGEPSHFKKRLLFCNDDLLNLLFGTRPLHHKVDDDLLNYIVENGLLNNSDFWRDARPAVIEHEKETGGFRFNPKYCLASQLPLRWHECPFDDLYEADNFIKAMRNNDAKIEDMPTAFGEGKEPELASARNCAIWPEATLDQLNDANALEARLPALMREFKQVIESLNFKY